MSGEVKLYPERGDYRVDICTCDTDVCLLHKAQMCYGYIIPVEEISLKEFKERYPSHPATNDPSIKGVFNG